MKLLNRTEDQSPTVTDGSDQVLILADRLREANGGVLDDSAILAVAEATGAPIDYVRLVVTTRSAERETSLLGKLRKTYLGFDPDIRHFVAAGALAVVYVLFSTIETFLIRTNWSNLFNILTFLAAGAGIGVAGLAKTPRRSAMAGFTFGAAAVLVGAVVHPLFGQWGGDAWMMVLYAIGAGLLSLILHYVFGVQKKKLGIMDPATERQELLKQLVDIQDKLRENEQAITFVSVDIVGSTQMKQSADQLSVEFTLNEYHKYAELIAKKNLGRVHSTAGDGITIAFDHPKNAIAAAKNFQVGLIELNTFRNKIGTPIRVRIGVHTGTIMAPVQGDIRSVNFASVIDLAAHLQKECPPGRVAISEQAALFVPGGPSSLGSEWIEVSGLRAVIWASKAMVAGEGQKSGPPPPPI